MSDAESGTLFIQSVCDLYESVAWPLLWRYAKYSLARFGLDDIIKIRVEK